jgi:protease I
MTTSGKRVAVLGEEGYQELEFWYPVMRLREEGITVVIAAPQAESAYESRLGYPLLAESAISALDPESLDAVVVPGKGAGEHLAQFGETVSLLSKVHARGGTVGVIGSGASVLEMAGIAPTADRVVVARTADDLPQLVHSLLELLGATSEQAA